MVVPVPDQLEYISDANGVTKIFPYPKRFLQKDEIVVALRDADGVDAIQTLNIDYTIAGSSWPNGGDVVFNIAPTSGYKVVLYRMTQAKQTVDLANNQRNDAPSVERQLDRLTMAIQDRGHRTDSAWFGLQAEIIARRAGDAALNSRVDKEIIDRENGDKAVASLVGQAGDIEVPMYDTRLAVTFANIKPTINSIRTGGYAAPGDGGAALYRWVATEPAHAGKVRSADGAWWELAELVPNARMFGAKGDGIANESPAFDAFFDYMMFHVGGDGRIPSGTYLLGSQINKRDATKSFRIRGDGLHNTKLIRGGAGTVIQIGRSDGWELSDFFVDAKRSTLAGGGR